MAAESSQLCDELIAAERSGARPENVTVERSHIRLVQFADLADRDCHPAETIRGDPARSLSQIDQSGSIRKGLRTCSQLTHVAHPQTSGQAIQHKKEAKAAAPVGPAESLTRDVFVSRLAESLASLVAAATALPEIDAAGEDLPDGPTLDQWTERFKAVRTVLGDWSGYWTTLGVDSGEAVLLPVADDLADIWRDIRRGLDGLEAGVPDDDVLWNWRFNCYAHWGPHASEALRVVFSLLRDNGGPLT